MTTRFQKIAAFASAGLLALAVLACAPAHKITKHPERVSRASGSGGPGSGALRRGGKPYTIRGVTYYPLTDSAGFIQTGVASWYGRDFHGRKTASGEIYNMHAMTAAHKTLPLGTIVEVRRIDDGRSLVVRINDRGPFAHNRIIDLSMAAAAKLGAVEEGTTMVTITALAEGKPGAAGEPPVAVSPPPDFYHGVFWVQVGAFAIMDNAERVRDRLGFPRANIRFQPTQANGGQTLHRVQVGPFNDMDQANLALTDAMNQGFNTAFVVAD
ncbi:MAG: septal ring lytic transglycosylase RlpA family protein [Nitrospinota bacterium]|nr:septal ring lytic transglycosylase RlpA family protein [Nitrospinota bacterium]